MCFGSWALAGGGIGETRLSQEGMVTCSLTVTGSSLGLGFQECLLPSGREPSRAGFCV